LPRCRLESVAAAVESEAETIYNWRDGKFELKLRGHVCDRDATCVEEYAYFVKELDGRPVVLCAYHYRTDVPKYLLRRFHGQREDPTARNSGLG